MCEGTSLPLTHLVAVSSDAHQKVVRLDVSVDEILIVDKLDPPYHLQ